MIARLHERVHERRCGVLARHLSELLAPDARVLDVGAGDGRLELRLRELRPDLALEAVDVEPRPGASVPVRAFDGRRLPCPARSYDAVLFVDVLHHAEDPAALLREGLRAARRHLVIKDHTRDGLLAGPTLRAMDWVGNARHGVALPYHYWSEAGWRRAFHELGLEVEVWRPALGLYPRSLAWAFERSLHFLARLRCPTEARRGPAGPPPV